MLPAQFSRSNWYRVRTIEQRREEQEEEEEEEVGREREREREKNEEVAAGHRRGDTYALARSERWQIPLKTEEQNLKEWNMSSVRQKWALH